MRELSQLFQIQELAIPSAADYSLAFTKESKHPSGLAPHSRAGGASRRSTSCNSHCRPLAVSRARLEQTSPTAACVSRRRRVALAAPCGRRLADQALEGARERRLGVV